MSNTSGWGFGQNPFYNATKNSFKLFNQVIADNKSRVQALSEDNPELFVIYKDEVKPAYDEWTDQYRLYDTANAYKKAATQTQNLLLNELSGKTMNLFANRIESVYPPDTPEILRFFPQGRKPFNSDVNEEKVEAMRVLHGITLADPELSIVHVEMATFFSQLMTARSKQQGYEGQVSTLRTILKQQHRKSANKMYGVLGLLMHLHADNSVAVEDYYDLSLIRNTGGGAPEEVDAAVVLTVNGGATVESGLNIEAETPLLIRNTGSASLQACMSLDSGAPCPDTVGVTIHPGEEVTTSPAALGRAEGGFLNITNTHPTITGAFEVFFM